MSPGRRQVVWLVVWTAVFAVLYFGFGLLLGRAVARTAEALGFIVGESAPFVAEVVSLLAGIGILGLSRLYRRTAKAENAGSVAALLAGSALVLYTLGLLLTRLSPGLAPLALTSLLVVWLVWRAPSWNRKGG